MEEKGKKEAPAKATENAKQYVLDVFVEMSELVAELHIRTHGNKWAR